MPASFASYDDATDFGATFHEMAETVDSGVIIGVEHFPRPAGIPVMDLERLAIAASLRLFLQFGPLLATDAQPLPAIPVAWGKPTRTRADFARMCRLDANLDESERVRRQEAFISVAKAIGFNIE